MAIIAGLVPYGVFGKFSLCCASPIELAEKLGINASTVSKYMRLDKYPSLETFANICEILEISSDEVLGLKQKHTDAPPHQEP